MAGRAWRPRRLLAYRDIKSFCGLSDAKENEHDYD